jgi:hypothetical protein
MTLADRVSTKTAALLAQPREFALTPMAAAKVSELAASAPGR